MKRLRILRIVGTALAWTILALHVRAPLGTAAPSSPAPGDSISALAVMRHEAAALEPLVRTRLAREFLAATEILPAIAPRTVLHDSARTRFWNPREAEWVSAEARQRLITRVLNEEFYYSTRYGTPLAYARPLEILAASGIADIRGKKLLDFGYGTIGHLRLLASMGAHAVGVEVDPMLHALYSDPSDQGAIRGWQGRTGTLRLLSGQFPAEPALVRAVGEGYDVFLSKNTLKNGYIHPAEPVDPRRLVHLGVDDTTFVRAVHRILRPGGRALIYNLCPAPAPPGRPYVPWADGRSPFSRALWEASGFRVIEFDRDDSPAARAMAHALGWDQGEGAMDLAKDLFATYTLVEKAVVTK